ncbi:hypothetical protein M8J77_021180 [Diaphorina citri]|nr:hypothetical protein M8J77_021180 [Diaphorina citri]
MNPGALSQQYCPQLNNYFMDNLTKQNEDVDPQSSTEPATMQDFDKELEDLEKDLSKSSESEMEVDTNDQQSNEQLSEAVEKLQIKEKFKSLSGAARKRFKWLIKQGLSAKEARSKAMEKIPETAIANKKRARSADSTPEEKGGKQSEQKRQKVHIASPKSTPVGLEVVPESSAATTSFANALRSIKVGVLAERYPEENLTNEQMVAIQAQILEKISEKEGGPDPQFSGIAHRPGWLSITCDDEATSQWLKSIIGEVKPWEGANLKVVEEGDLPKSKILSAYFPSSSEDTTEKILKMVKKQNSRLATSEWKILRRNNEGTAAHVIMSVDLASVELLKTLSYKISFKFGKVTLHNKSEQKSKPNVPKPAKASSQPSGTGTAKATPQPSVSKPAKASNQPPGTQTAKADPKPSVSTPAKADPGPSGTTQAKATPKPSKVGTSTSSQGSSLWTRREERGRHSDTPLKGLRPGKGKKDWKPRPRSPK